MARKPNEEMMKRIDPPEEMLDALDKALDMLEDGYEIRRGARSGIENLKLPNLRRKKVVPIGHA